MYDNRLRKNNSARGDIFFGAEGKNRFLEELGVRLSNADGISYLIFFDDKRKPVAVYRERITDALSYIPATEEEKRIALKGR